NRRSTASRLRFRPSRTSLAFTALVLNRTRQLPDNLLRLVRQKPRPAPLLRHPAVIDLNLRRVHDRLRNLRNRLRLLHVDAAFPQIVQRREQRRPQVLYRLHVVLALICLFSAPRSCTTFASSFGSL